jgi:thiamine-monophosphate kinase
MSELDFLAKLRNKVPVRSSELIAGIGDDCAIIRLRGATDDLLVTTDMTIEGVHFRSSDPLDYVGKKALARGLSDIAAMGGDPKFGFVSIAAPSEAAIEKLYEGILALAAETSTTIAGGDLSRSETITLDVVVQGSVPSGEALRRDTAKAGDFLCVSGPLGRAASRDYVDMPEPRLAFGRSLRSSATACMDLSDGLCIDLYRMCVASGLRAEITEVPLFEAATLEHGLYGGEDYELLFTLPRNKLPDGAFLVGNMLEGEPALTYRGKPIEPGGHDHFRRIK